MSNEKIELSTSDVVNALLHARQSEHHYATQESVDNLKDQMNTRFESMQEQMNTRFESMQEQMNTRFESVDQRFEQVDKRFDQIDKRFEQSDKKLDRIQWFIVAAALTALFKDNILAFFA